MKKPEINMRNAAGMYFSSECRWYFWTGWIAWVVSLWSLTLAEFFIRVPKPPAPYLAEAAVAFVGPFVLFAVADTYAINHYQSAWFHLNWRELGSVVLQQDVIDRIRQELRFNLVLTMFRPPRSKEIRGHLLTSALWWQAVTSPEDSPWTRRYGEWMVDVLLGYLPLGLTPFLVMVLILNDSHLERWAIGIVALLLGLGLAVIGLSSMRLAARRQAILDYFNAWCSEHGGDPSAPTSSEP